MKLYKNVFGSVAFKMLPDLCLFLAGGGNCPIVFSLLLNHGTNIGAQVELVRVLALQVFSESFGVDIPPVLPVLSSSSLLLAVEQLAFVPPH